MCCYCVDIEVNMFVIVHTNTLTCFVIVYTLTSDSFPRGGCAAKARRPSLRPSCGKCCTGVRVCTRERGGCCAPDPSQTQRRGTEHTTEKLTTSYSKSGDTDLRHGNSCTGVQRWDKDKDWDKDSRTSNCNTAILNVQNEDHGQLAARGQRHQGLELGGAHQRLRLGRALRSWKQEHTTSTTTYTTQDQRLQ